MKCHGSLFHVNKTVRTDRRSEYHPLSGVWMQLGKWDCVWVSNAVKKADSPDVIISISVFFGALSLCAKWGQM